VKKEEERDMAANTKEEVHYTVQYDSESHLKVIKQMHGSVLPKVLPWCILNVCISVAVEYLNIARDARIPVTVAGHKLLTVFVAFLIVSRVTISLKSYNGARQSLAVMYRETRAVVMYAATFTKHLTDAAAKAWRYEVFYRTCLLLRTAMAVIDHGEADAVLTWELPELTGVEKDDIMSVLQQGTGTANRWAHALRSEKEENMRVPIRVAYLLRKSIMSSKSRLSDKFVKWQYNKLFGSVDTFMNGYYGIRKSITTPFPFPLLQMARTFLFFYVFTLPLALVNDPSAPAVHAITVFLVTYGFLGLETVSIELDDPFGDDANDFKNLLMSYAVFEDVYTTVADVDGDECADKLRNAMSG